MKKKCWVCGKKYDFSRKFKYHHKDGDPSHTVVDNLVLLCSEHNDEIHGLSDRIVKEYVINKKRESLPSNQKIVKLSDNKKQ